MSEIWLRPGEEGADPVLHIRIVEIAAIGRQQDGSAPAFFSRSRRMLRKFLEAMAHLGLAPWVLFQLAAYAADFLMQRVSAPWFMGRGCEAPAGIVFVRITEVAIAAPGSAISVPMSCRTARAAGMSPPE